ncbi:MAG: coenzyme F420 hydrogenase/dehydrogenase beta subunit N-terminal domain-containing protein [Candidatus Methanospirareceae archaeon]
MPAYDELESEVIEGGLCTYCGACVASCPLGHLKWIDGRPKRPEKKAACEDCEVCYHACYRTEFEKGPIEEEIFGRRGKEDEDIGIYRRVVAARATDESILEKAQDGGVATAILVYMLEEKLIDGAMLTDRGREEDDWIPFPKVAKSKEEIISAAGTKYGVSPNLMMVRTAVVDEVFDNLCIVGLPCHVRR